jgi:two-component system, LytTR family, response regulator
VTSPIRTVIADDEVLARRALRVLLASAADVQIVGECRDGHEVVDMLRAQTPELLFLDIRMPGLDGFRALERAAHAPVTVFVTAHEEHALRAFDIDAVDYLLKPFDDDRFRRALQRARACVQRRRETSDPVNARIAVKDGQRTELVDPAAIDCITALGYYAELHVAGRALLLREPLQDLERRLDPTRFVRIHRSTIVNVSRVARLDRLPYGDFEVTLRDGTRLRMSRARRRALERLLPR